MSKGKCKVLLVMLFVGRLACLPLAGQGIGINEDGSLPHPSAMLDVSAANRGLLIPRMDEAVRLQITDPANGLLVFQTSHPAGLYYHLNGSWEYIGHVASLPAGVSDADGNHYPVVMLAGRLFTAKNLRTGRFSNGDPIPLAEDAAAWSQAGGPVLTRYNFLVPPPAHKAFGLLYNGHAVKDARGICPVGWRVMNEHDWQALSDALVVVSFDALAGGNWWGMQQASPLNVSGLSVLPAGLCNDQGHFAHRHSRAALWVSREDAPGMDPLALLVYPGQESPEPGALPLSSGLSVRCVKDVE